MSTDDLWEGYRPLAPSSVTEDHAWLLFLGVGLGLGAEYGRACEIATQLVRELDGSSPVESPARQVSDRIRELVAADGESQ